MPKNDEADEELEQRRADLRQDPVIICGSLVARLLPKRRFAVTIVGPRGGVSACVLSKERTKDLARGLRDFARRCDATTDAAALLRRAPKFKIGGEHGSDVSVDIFGSREIRVAVLEPFSYYPKPTRSVVIHRNAARHLAEDLSFLVTIA
jgi:hypothetical protein